MASIVEKEGVITKNLGPVARVILNRLATDMPLQMDSTVLYAEGRDGGAVTADRPRSSRRRTTPTCNEGLTPTPICFPSPAALQAALDPPGGSWLYFVVVEQDGTEAFADTYAQQLANEALGQSSGACPDRAGLDEDVPPCPTDRSRPARPASRRPPRWSG